MKPSKSPKSPPIRREIFALFLFARRLTRGVSQWQCARQARVAVGAVKRAESKRRVSVREFERLCLWQGDDPAIFAI